MEFRVAKIIDFLRIHQMALSSKVGYHKKCFCPAKYTLKTELKILRVKGAKGLIKNNKLRGDFHEIETHSQSLYYKKNVGNGKKT